MSVNRSGTLVGASASHATCTVTVTGPGGSTRLYLSQVWVSFTAPVTTASTVILNDTATSTAYTLAEIPVGIATDPNQLMSFSFPVPQGLTKGGGFTIVVTDCGTGVVCNILAQYISDS